MSDHSINVVSNAPTMFDEVYSRVMKMIKLNKVNAGDLVVISTYAMTTVQKYPNLDGPSKKQLVIDVITKVVHESDIFAPEDKMAGDMFIQLTLPMLIDTIINAYNHKVDLKKIKASCVNCFKSI